MADRIIVRSSTAYRDYSRPPDGLPSVILPWLRFQSLSRSSATQQVKRVISVWFWDLLEVFKAVFRHLNRYNSLRWHVTVNQGRWKKVYFIAPGNGNFFEKKKITRDDSVFTAQTPQPSYKGNKQKWQDKSEWTLRGLDYSVCAVPRYSSLKNLQAQNEIQTSHVAL